MSNKGIDLINVNGGNTGYKVIRKSELRKLEDKTREYARIKFWARELLYIALVMISGYIAFTAILK